MLLASVLVTIFAGQPVNTFDPRQAIGAGVDGHEQGEVARMLSPQNVKEMRTAGFRPLTYRLRTELAVEAWHWNPIGTWSDPAHEQGYWVSSSKSAQPILESYGYRLPRRGNTLDQANNDGYSRIDDGDENTFWKSNPYLDRHFTHEPNSAHPQWIVIDFGKTRLIDTVRILWGTPYATRFRIEYSDEPETERVTIVHQWTRFASGLYTAAHGGLQTLRVSAAPVRAHFIRVYMTESSDAPPRGSTDVRDGLGYAVREIYAGTRGRSGKFHDYINHDASHQRQSVIWVSSNDPWHRASDRDDRVEQPGFDRIYRDGLTNGLPVLMSAPLLYDVPENTVAELAYLRQHDYAISALELGEEPDGQRAEPEDYAALFAQWAAQLRGVELGGPSLATIDADYAGWMHRLLSHLDKHGALQRFNFFSFEWYPFDEVCSPAEPQMLAAPGLLRKAIEALRSEPMLQRVPWRISEYGYSALSTRAEVDVQGAILNADILGAFLTLGGSSAYVYGYEPNELLNESGCSWGNNMLFGIDENNGIAYRTATYYGARLLNDEWLAAAGTHELYRTESDDEHVTSYAVKRPDGKWSVLLLNKDETHAQRVEMKVDEADLGGPADVFQFSREQYVWKTAGNDGHPIRSHGAEHHEINSKEPLSIELPPDSLTVVRTR